MKRKRHRQGDFDGKLDRKAIDLLLNLRRVGWSYNALSSFFGVSRQATRYQCEKYGVFTEYGMRIPDILGGKDTKRWRYEDGERINKGKSYADYLKAYKNRFPSRKR